MMSTARIRVRAVYFGNPMAQVSQLSPELTRGLQQLARALLAAARNWSLYPPEHPTVASSVSRLGAAIQEASGGAAFAIGVTPDSLMIEGTRADSNQSSIVEAAAFLHDRDIVTLSFIGEVPPDALYTFLRILTLETGERRARGGPAAIWAKEGDPSIAIEQMDYKSLLAREEGEVSEPAR